MTDRTDLFDRVLIDQITVRDRVRQDLDLDPMVESMEKHGLLQPIGLTSDLVLVFGERRLRAAQRLGWDHIDALVGERSEIETIEQERAENTDRKDFSPVEMVMIGRKLRDKLESEAEERQKSGLKNVGDDRTEKLPEWKKGRVRDKLGAIAGKSGKTFDKAEAVIEAAEKDPERYGHLVRQMQRTGKVNAAYSKLRKAEDEDRVLDLKPIEGKFRTLIMDPPWDMDKFSKTAKAPQEFATMTLDEIEDIQPAQWADDELCHLYLWAPNGFVSAACKIMEAWGFEQKSCLTWKKPKIGQGRYFRNDTEQVLFGVCGRAKKKTTRADDIPTWFEGSTGVDKHSAKPDEFYALVRKASFEPIGEAFGRKEREGITELYEKITEQENTL